MFLSEFRGPVSLFRLQTDCVLAYGSCSRKGMIYRAPTNYTRRMTTMQNPYVDDENTPLPDQTPQSPQSQQSPQFPPSRSYSYLNEQYGQFGQPQSMPPSYQSPQPSHQPAPGQFQPPPTESTPTARP